MRVVWLVLAVLGRAAGTVPRTAGRLSSQCQLSCRRSVQQLSATPESLGASCRLGCRAYNASAHPSAPRCLKYCLDRLHREEEKIACQTGCTEARYLLHMSTPPDGRRQDGQLTVRGRRAQRPVDSREQRHMMEAAFLDMAPVSDPAADASASQPGGLGQEEMEEERQQQQQQHLRQLSGAGVGRPAPSGIDFLECVSRRTGLPRWLVGLVLTSALLVTVWLSASFLLALTPMGESSVAVWSGGAVPVAQELNDCKVLLLNSEEAQRKTPLGPPEVSPPRSPPPPYT